MDASTAFSLCSSLLAVGATAWCVISTAPLRARVAQLELERPAFIAELNGLLEECTATLKRADGYRKRADNQMRAVANAAGVAPTGDVTPQPAIPFRRGTMMERLPGT